MALLVAACGSASTVETLPGENVGGASTFTVDVWADNWFALYVNGALVGEDSIPITTERSFNKETFTFDAAYPLTIAIEARDFKEDDSGLEYIGTDRQQMGDGGLIAQFFDVNGEMVAATSKTWAALVIHKAPTNKDCELSASPLQECNAQTTDLPTDWTSASFDDSAWEGASEWSAADVSPKGGYDEVSWHESAYLIWGTDLESDNTVLLRYSTSG